MSLVSIVTPVLNGSKYIETLLKSIKNQTYPNVEHLVMDGGSTDGTQEIAKGYGARVYSQKDSGTSEAVNRGILLAKGEIIGIIAFDDLFMSYTIKKVVSAFQTHDADCIYGDTLLTDIDLNNAIVAFNPVVTDLVTHLKYGFFNAHPFFWKREVFERHGGFDVRFKARSDYEFFVRVSKHLKFHKLDEVLAIYRYNGIGISQRDRKAFDRENSIINRRYGTESLVISPDLFFHALTCSIQYSSQILRMHNGSAWSGFKSQYKVSNIGLFFNLPISIVYIFGVRLGRKVNHGFVKPFK